MSVFRKAKTEGKAEVNVEDHPGLRDARAKLAACEATMAPLTNALDEARRAAQEAKATLDAAYNDYRSGKAGTGVVVAARGVSDAAEARVEEARRAWDAGAETVEAARHEVDRLDREVRGARLVSLRAEYQEAVRALAAALERASEANDAVRRLHSEAMRTFPGVFGNDKVFPLDAGLLPFAWQELRPAYNDHGAWVETPYLRWLDRVKAWEEARRRG